MFRSCYDSPTRVLSPAVSGVALDVLMAELEHLEIPDIRETVSMLDVEVKKYV